MNITGSSAAVISATASGAQAYDAVGITMMRKSMDIQQSMANQLIQSVAQSVPAPAGNSGHNIDIYV